MSDPEMLAIIFELLFWSLERALCVYPIQELAAAAEAAKRVVARVRVTKRK